MPSVKQLPYRSSQGKGLVTKSNMHFITKVFWFSLSLVALVDYGGSMVVTDMLEKGFWKNINMACTAVIGEVKKVLDKDDVKHLSLIEYGPLFEKRHSMYPSAAESLLEGGKFDKNRKTVIFMHGFIDNPLLFSGQSFAIAYEAHGGYNILALDSHKLIGMFYLRSSVLVKYIGNALAHFVKDLVDSGMDVENIHLVGHSLGAHIAGFAGKAFQKLRPGSQLPRITGLDPAGPCFSEVTPDQRLDKGDARFVDVIHTNINGYGIEAPVGHVDFYPNGGGIQQPFCIESICSHNRVWMLYEESVIRERAFVGVHCDSWLSFREGHCTHNERVVMGMSTPNTTRGLYYLRTNPIPPYGMGGVGAKPKLTDKIWNLFHE